MVAQRHRVVDDLKLLHHAGRDVRALGLCLEGHHSGEISHLPFGQLMLRVGGEAGVEDPAPLRAILEDRGEMHRGLQVQRVQFLPAADHGAAHRIAMAADVFGEGMHHEIGAQRQRLRSHGGGIGRIHRHVAHALVMGEPGEERDIAQPHRGVGGRLEPQHAGFRADGGRDLLRARGIDVGYLDAETRQRVAREFGDADVIGVRHDQVVAPAEAAADQRMRGGDARRVAQSGLGPFEGCELLLQLRNGRAADASIDVAFIPLLVAGGKAGQGLRREGDGHHQVG